MKTVARTIALATVVVVATLYGHTNVARGSASETRTIKVARARLWCTDSHGQNVRKVRERAILDCTVAFTLPRAFPSGYSDVRIEIVAHGRAQRTVVWGTPQHLHAQQTLRVVVPVLVSPAWIGTAKLVATVRLLAKPGGADLPYMGRGTATFTVLK